MLHGWGFPAAVFSRLATRMPAGTEVWTPDRPGYGTRQGDPLTRHSIIIDSPTLVLGWSLGSQDALHIALAYPQRVTGIILLAGTPCFVNRQDWPCGMDAAVFAGFRQQVEQDAEAAMKQFVSLNGAARPDRETRSCLQAMARQVDDNALLDGLAELEKNDLRAAVEQIDVPAVLLHARDDRVVPFAASEWLARSMPDARLVEYGTGGHAFFIPHADDVAMRIREML